METLEVELRGSQCRSWSLGVDSPQAELLESEQIPRLRSEPMQQSTSLLSVSFPLVTGERVPQGLTRLILLFFLSHKMVMLMAAGNKFTWLGCSLIYLFTYSTCKQAYRWGPPSLVRLWLDLCLGNTTLKLSPCCRQTCQLLVVRTRSHLRDEPSLKQTQIQVWLTDEDDRELQGCLERNMASGVVAEGLQMDRWSHERCGCEEK